MHLLSVDGHLQHKLHVVQDASRRGEIVEKHRSCVFAFRLSKTIESHQLLETYNGQPTTGSSLQQSVMGDHLAVQVANHQFEFVIRDLSRPVSIVSV